MRSNTKCPHENIVNCPLYHASHAPTEFPWCGCDDGKWYEGGCGVDRGQDYAATVAKMRAIDPRFIAEMEWREEAEKSKEQRACNLRAAGLH